MIAYPLDMASITPDIKFCLVLLLMVISSFSILHITKAGDPDILSDSSNGSDVNFFTYTGMRVIFDPETPIRFNFTIIEATMAEFPALSGQSVSFAFLIFPRGTCKPLHIHPRSAEFIHVVAGAIKVGFVDTTNRLYFQTLLPGDMFVFPKGLVHFQYNADPNNVAFAISAFGSANAGTVFLPSTLFATEIDDQVLAQSFKTNVTIIQALKSGLAPA